MARLTGLSIKGYRSVKDEISIKFPANAPVALVGENNSGKSNIVRALDLILGEFWPGSHDPEDHEFWNRDKNGKIEIRVDFDDFHFNGKYGDENITGLRWSYDKNADEPIAFVKIVNGSGNRYVSNALRSELLCIVVGADRRLSYQLSYTSKWTLLSKLMRKFHGRLTENEKRVSKLKKKFDEIKKIFEEVTEFANFQSEIAKEFVKVFEGMTYGLQIDFSAYDPSNFFHSLRVMPEEDDKPRTFEELGTGQEQLLALAFSHAYAKAFFGGIVLVIEEPEAHLHPLAQQWLARKITEMARDGLQILMTTHSPAFIDILGLEGIVLVRKNEGATSIIQRSSNELADHCVAYGADSHRTDVGTVLPFYASSATQEILNGLFAKKIVLVEGATESLSLPIYLANAGLDVTKEGIAIINVMGKGNLAKWWRFFTAYEIPVFLTFDNDSKNDNSGTKRKDALITIGCSNEKCDEAMKISDWYVGNKACVFGVDYEDTMRKSFSKYEELEKEAKSQIGTSKPLIARYVADKLQYDESEDGWKKISKLKEKLINLS